MNVLRRKTVEADGESYQLFSVEEKHPLQYLLSEKPNDVLTAFDFMKNAVLNVLLRGNAYILPVYDRGEVKKLLLLQSDRVTYDVLTNTYAVNDDYNHIHGEYYADEIIHLRNFSLDGGYTGSSTIAYAGKVLQIGMKTDELQIDSFKPGSTTRGFISGDNTVTQGFGQLQDDQLEAVSERVERELGSGKRIFQLPGVMRFNQLALSPADLQLLDSKKFNVLEICRFFGVHPDKVFAQTSTNYKASENSQTVYMTDTLAPLLIKIENEFKVKLIPQSVAADYKIKFNLEDYYQSDVLAEADYFTKMVQAGGMTPNEVRLRKGRKPLPGGNKLFVSCNVAPADSAKINGDKQTEASRGQNAE
jgi:HK97 family phage portal protein